MMPVSSSSDSSTRAHRTCPENLLPSLGVQSWVQTQRLLIRWVHDPQTIVQAMLMPAGFLVTLNLVFGKAISEASGQSALYGSVPMVALVGAVLGASAAGVSLMRERADGLLARFWVLPISRVSGPLARLSAEMIRILLTGLVVLSTGLALGFRFRQGILAIAAWLLVPVAFGIAFAVLVTTLALHVVNTVLVEASGLVIMLLVFFCTGFVPLAHYPPCLQPLVAHQPLSYAVEAMRALSLGGSVLTPMVATLLWSAGTIAACAVPLVTGYRRASTH